MLKNDGVLQANDLKKQLKRFMKLNKLKSINEVQQIAVADLLKMEGFGYRLLIEVILSDHGK